MGSFVSNLLCKSKEVRGCSNRMQVCGSSKSEDTSFSLPQSIIYLLDTLGKWSRERRYAKSAREIGFQKFAFLNGASFCLHHQFWCLIWLLHLPFASLYHLILLSSLYTLSTCSIYYLLSTFAFYCSTTSPLMSFCFTLPCPTSLWFFFFLNFHLPFGKNMPHVIDIHLNHAT